MEFIFYSYFDKFIREFISPQDQHSHYEIVTSKTKSFCKIRVYDYPVIVVMRIEVTSDGQVLSSFSAIDVLYRPVPSVPLEKRFKKFVKEFTAETRNLRLTLK